MENTLDKKYNKTIYAGFVGYVVQAIVNNFVPLLFLTFQDTYGITFNKISMLITINFAVQLVVDLLSAKFIDKIGYRISIIIAHVASALGLIGLAFLEKRIKTIYKKHGVHGKIYLLNLMFLLCSKVCIFYISSLHILKFWG